MPGVERTLPAMLLRAAAVHGDRPLLCGFGRSSSYAEVVAAASRRAGALAAAGVGRGDRVAVVSENRLEVVELWLGCAWLGAVLVPLNTALPAERLEEVLAAAEPRLVLRGEEIPDGDAIAPAPVAPGDPAAILFTSGTTGTPKGVVCPHEQWYWWGVVSGRALGIGAGDVLYTNLPLFHTNALNAFWQAVLAGATYILGPRFSASAFWERVTEAGATVTYLLGPMVSILLRRGDDAPGHRLRVALAPGTPAGVAHEFTARYGVRLVDGWGSTETNFVLAGEPGTLGRPQHPFEARVGEDGELLVRTREPGAFATGYLGSPPFGEWFATGDRARVDADGVFHFVDRIKEVVRRRGETVSTHEVEQALLAHPAVSAAAVVGVPSELGEEEVMAFVVGAVEPEELLRSCEPRLPYFAVPRYVEVVRELPLTPTGKIEKYKLRERGVGNETWDAETAGYRPSRG